MSILYTSTSFPSKELYYFAIKRIGSKLGLIGSLRLPVSNASDTHFPCKLIKNEGRTFGGHMRTASQRRKRDY